VTLRDDGSLTYEAKSLGEGALPEGFPEMSRQWFEGIAVDKTLAALSELDLSEEEREAMADIADYDTVYFGFPCWWGDLPMPVYTAIEALDWSGKTISPFNTHAGSGESGMFFTLADKCTGATVTSGLTLSGETAQNDRAEAEASVDSWLSSLG
jgi:flavodoxin